MPRDTRLMTARRVAATATRCPEGRRHPIAGWTLYEVPWKIGRMPLAAPHVWLEGRQIPLWQASDDCIAAHFPEDMEPCQAFVVEFEDQDRLISAEARAGLEAYCRMERGVTRAA